MRAIMYHYVRETDPAFPNFRFLDVANFRKQLDYFADHFGFVTLEEWRNCLRDTSINGLQGKVLLTFDDAMYCHYQYVYPELVKRGLWGIFYVPTQPYLENHLLNVHKIHLLCGAHEGQSLLSIAHKFTHEDMIPFEKREEFRDATYTTQKNFAACRNLSAY